MSDQDKHITKISHDFSTLRELFMEYVTFDYPQDNQTRELTIPWYSVDKILSRTDKDNYDNTSKSCTEIWFNTADGRQSCYVNETPQQVQTKLEEAKQRMLAEIRKNRMMII